MARNAVRVTPYSITYEYDDGEIYLVYFDTRDEMFYEAAKFHAFDDLDYGMRIVEINDDGKTVHYIGWRPGMRIVFKDTEGKVAWDEKYPQWDH